MWRLGWLGLFARSGSNEGRLILSRVGVDDAHRADAGACCLSMPVAGGGAQQVTTPSSRASPLIE